MDVLNTSILRIPLRCSPRSVRPGEGTDHRSLMPASGLTALNKPTRASATRRVRAGDQRSPLPRYCGLDAGPMLWPHFMLRHQQTPSLIDTNRRRAGTAVCIESRFATRYSDHLPEEGCDSPTVTLTRLAAYVYCFNTAWVAPNRCESERLTRICGFYRFVWDQDRRRK